MGTRQALGAALLRVMLGVIYVMHGYHAWAVLGPERTAAMIADVGYAPALADVLAWTLMAAHAVGGLFLILGLWTVWAALAQVPIIASAVFVVHLDEGFFMRGVAGEAATGRAAVAGLEFPLLVLVATVALMLMGPGAFAVDVQRGRMRRPRHGIP